MGFPIGFFLYPIRSRQGITEHPDLGGEEGEHHEEQGDPPECRYRHLGTFTGHRLPLEEPCLVEVGQCRRDKENGDVDPVGGRAYYPVVGVEQDGDESKTQ